MNWIVPNWHAPSRVKALSTIREGGVSRAPFDGLNLAHHVGDELLDVTENRATLIKRANMPTEPLWLNQVHGVEVITLPYSGAPHPDADASYTRTPNQVCAVMTADCLPVLLCNARGNEVSAVHAGWKGLLDGVIESAIDKFKDKHDMIAWLGPAIGPRAFEVQDDVRDAFIFEDRDAKIAFIRTETGWLGNLYQLAHLRLEKRGVTKISGGEYCTFSDPERFFSFRRDKVTGRQATCIWIED